MRERRYKPGFLVELVVMVLLGILTGLVVAWTLLPRDIAQEPSVVTKLEPAPGPPSAPVAVAPAVEEPAPEEPPEPVEEAEIAEEAPQVDTGIIEPAQRLFAKARGKLIVLCGIGHLVSDGEISYYAGPYRADGNAVGTDDAQVWDGGVALTLPVEGGVAQLLRDGVGRLVVTWTQGEPGQVVSCLDARMAAERTWLQGRLVDTSGGRVPLGVGSRTERIVVMGCGERALAAEDGSFHMEVETGPCALRAVAMNGWANEYGPEVRVTPQVGHDMLDVEVVRPAMPEFEGAPEGVHEEMAEDLAETLQVLRDLEEALSDTPWLKDGRLQESMDRMEGQLRELEAAVEADAGD